MSRQRSLAGATALVTGGASGIGRALGRALAAAGAQVVLADLDAAATETAAVEIGRGTSAAVLDVTDRGAFAAVVDHVVERHGHLDLLVNNAGVSIGGATHELSADEWDRAVAVNIGGVVNGVLATYPRMVQRGAGQIVNTASAAGLAAPPFVAPYAMTKHGVVGLSLGLRPEAARHGVRVNVICPGAVDTPILDAPSAGGLTARQYLAVLRQQPMPADRFADIALRGIRRDRAIIVAPAGARALWWMHRLSPRLTGATSRVIAGRVERAMERQR